MNKKWGWVLLIVLGLVFLFGLPYLWNILAGTGGYYGMMGPGMMGGWGSMNFWPFIGMALMWFVPVGGLVILITGIVSFVQSVQRMNRPSDYQASCPNCQKSVQTDWTTCPYCAEKL